MAVVINPDSDLAREMAKWDKPYVFRPFPKMVYKAFKRENGKVMCGDNPLAHRDERAQLDAEAFARSCQLIVQDDAELDRARGMGWRDTPGEALALFEAVEQDIARAAAEANYTAARMSEQARAEHKAATDATHQHVTDVVPVKRGRPRAVVAVEE